MHIKYRTQETIYPVVLPSQPHTSLLRLSEIDQLMSLRNMVPQLYFFRQGSSQANTTALKKSLAEVLAIFYPLAGRLVEREGEDGGRLDVSCRDQGAAFCEAWADAGLDVFEPDFQPHASFQLLAPTHDPSALLQVQVTHFECGGMCLCIACHHTLCDGISAAYFIELWSKITGAKENYMTLQPLLDRSILADTYYIRKLVPLSLHHPNYCISMENISRQNLSTIASKVFHFTPQVIKALKEEANVNVGYPSSSFECLTAHLWKNITQASGLSSIENIKLGIAVDGRKRFNPPLPSCYFGNCVFEAYATTIAKDLVERPLSYAIDLIKKSISRITDDYMRSGLEWMSKQSTPVWNSTANLSITTWTKLSFCDVDFGWGKPIFIRLPPPPPGLIGNNIFLLPSSFGKGYIDAMIFLNVEHMHKLETLINR